MYFHPFVNNKILQIFSSKLELIFLELQIMFEIDSQ